MNKEIFQAMNDLSKAMENAEDKYLEYVSAVRKAKSAAQKLEKITSSYLEKPHINIGDFEIDN